MFLSEYASNDDWIYVSEKMPDESKVGQKFVVLVMKTSMDGHSYQEDVKILRKHGNILTFPAGDWQNVIAWKENR